MDLGVMGTRFARIVLSIATIHDVLLWVVLAVATGLVSAEAPSVGSIALTIFLTLAFFGMALFLMPRVVRTLLRSRYNLLLRSSPSAYVLFVCFLFAAVASFLSINMVFGALLAGIVIGMMPRKFLRPAKNSIKDIALALFVPLYFSIVGLKLDFIHHFAPIFFLWFLAFTTLFQFLGTIISARLIKKDWLSSFNLGVAMSTRGGPGIVLATVAFDLGIINESFFLTLVLIAITTSLFAGTWFRYVINRGWNLLNNDEQPSVING
jgi:Kef-type K+ transport system membrane component KefB